MQTDDDVPTGKEKQWEGGKNKRKEEESTYKGVGKEKKKNSTTNIQERK